MSRPKIVPAHISKFDRFIRHGLNERQARIADMVRHGFKNKEIADELGISLRVVGFYTQETLKMLGLARRKELVWLWRNGEP